MSTSTHQLSKILDRDDSCVLRVTLADGGAFRLRALEPVDPSIYGDTDRWCDRVEQAVSGSHPDFVRLYPVGSLIDIHEADIAEVFDESSGDIVYARGYGTPTI